MAASLFTFLFFEEVLSDDFQMYNELLYRVPEEVVILLLKATCSNRVEHIRISNFFEVTVPSYSLEDFRRHFRMSRTTITVLENLLSGYLPQFNDHGGRPPVELRKQILLTLWVLGNPECLRSIADRFNVCEASVYRVYRRVCRATVTHLMDVFIKFPTGERAQEIMGAFERKRGIPSVLGAIDGTHIPIKGPRKNAEQYINRKGFFSVQLQVICDHQLLFTDVFCGYPGSVHDSRVFHNSPFFHAVDMNQANYLPGNSHILGDAAYTLRTWLLTPFRNNGHLTVRQKKYNKAQSSTRMVVEKAIGLLKNRFRKLKTLMDIDRTVDLPEIVASACVLHNVCIIENDIEEFLDSDSDDEDEDDGDGGSLFPPGVGANDKRNMIMRLIP